MGSSRSRRDDQQSTGLLSLYTPCHTSTRHVVAVAQMLTSALLIHITGGRIETHFHVFGSLAFLAFYRDWRVFIPATIVVGLDHMVRGIFWPQSVCCASVRRHGAAEYAACDFLGHLLIPRVVAYKKCTTSPTIVPNLRTPISS